MKRPFFGKATLHSALNNCLAPREEQGSASLTETNSTSERRPWTSSDQSRQRAIDTAIEILSSRPFSSLTSRTLAAAADVSNSSISRNFGSMEGLFLAVIKELDRRFALLSASGVGAELIDEGLILRSRLVAWMLGEGMHPPVMKVERMKNFMENRQISRETLSERTSWIFAQVALFLGEGFATFGPTHPRLNPGELGEAMQLIDWIRSHLEDAERDLGWGEEVSAKA
jgi:AcrR family transcriptional regulator